MTIATIMVEEVTILVSEAVDEEAVGVAGMTVTAPVGIENGVLPGPGDLDKVVPKALRIQTGKEQAAETQDPIVRLGGRRWYLETAPRQLLAGRTNLDEI